MPSPGWAGPGAGSLQQRSWWQCLSKGTAPVGGGCGEEQSDFARDSAWFKWRGRAGWGGAGG